MVDGSSAPFAEWQHEELFAFFGRGQEEGPFVVREALGEEVPQEVGSWRCLSLNVMMDGRNGSAYMAQVGQHGLRFRYVIDFIANNDFHIVLLNEVTPTFLALLTTNSTIAQRYISSENCRGSHLGMQLMGNVILLQKHLFSMVQFQALYLPKLPRPCVVAIVGDYAICSAHLSALSTNQERRAMQLQSLVAQLTRLHAGCMLIISGDLNWHDDSEVAGMPDGFATPAETPITFDGTVNSMHRFLWPLGYESRRMRLDRVVHSQNVTVSPPVRCLDNPVFPDRVESVSVVRAEGFFTRLVQTAGFFLPEPHQYLFPSDHFGLTFQVFLL